MGCDIHFFVERKIIKECYFCKANTCDRPEITCLCCQDHEPDKWISCDIWKETEWGYSRIPFGKNFYNGRNYKLFAKLTDVRNYEQVKPISQQRGLPKDIGRLVYKAYINDINIHSTSWLTLEEMLKEDWTGSEYKEFTKTLKEMKKLGDPDKVRAVFWFDN